MVPHFLSIRKGANLLKKILIAINLKKSAPLVFSIPPSVSSENACVERVFSLMGNIWKEERDRLLPETVKAELHIKINYNLSCEEFYHSIKQNNKLLAACISNKKYTFYWTL